MEFFKNAVELLELLIKALNGNTGIAFAYCSDKNVNCKSMSYKVFKPP